MAVIPDATHLTLEDAAELQRLLLLVFRGDEPAAAKWLQDRDNGVFRCAPLEMLKRDEIGVVRVLSYLRDCAS